ncbi:MAG: hypothetical protein AAF968_18640 [Pseudomonadota bacterium]
MRAAALILTMLIGTPASAELFNIRNLAGQTGTDGSLSLTGDDGTIVTISAGRTLGGNINNIAITDNLFSIDATNGAGIDTPQEDAPTGPDQPGLIDGNPGGVDDVLIIAAGTLKTLVSINFALFEAEGTVGGNDSFTLLAGETLTSMQVIGTGLVPNRLPTSIFDTAANLSMPVTARFFGILAPDGNDEFTVQGFDLSAPVPIPASISFILAAVGLLILSRGRNVPRV